MSYEMTLAMLTHNGRSLEPRGQKKIRRIGEHELVWGIARVRKCVAILVRHDLRGTVGTYKRSLRPKVELRIERVLSSL